MIHWKILDFYISKSCNVPDTKFWPAKFSDPQSCSLKIKFRRDKSCKSHFTIFSGRRAAHFYHFENEICILKITWNRRRPKQIAKDRKLSLSLDLSLIDFKKGDFLCGKAWTWFIDDLGSNFVIKEKSNFLQTFEKNQVFIMNYAQNGQSFLCVLWPKIFTFSSNEPRVKRFAQPKNTTWKH